MKHVASVVVACVVAGCTATRDRIPADSARVGVNGSVGVAAASKAATAGQFETLYDKPVDSKYRLILSRARQDAAHRLQLRVQLVETANRDRVWEVATLSEGHIGEVNVALGVLRADSSSIVISQSGDYGRIENLKLFIDPSSKKLIRQVEFPPTAGLDSVADKDAVIALGLPKDVITALKKREPRPAPGEPEDSLLPKILKDNPMPHSSHADFVRARQERVEDGYGPESEIGEMPGPLQIDGTRIWFGKTFYDGEGASGVGGAGYFDTIKLSYTFLKIPEMAEWSVSSLLHDERVLWIGLVGHPEGADYGGGLLRHDLATGLTRKYAIDDVILRIVRWNGRIYLATAGGVSVIEGNRVSARYLVEPGLGGRFIVVPLRP